MKKPFECPAFGTLCTPQNPLGATMVSSEALVLLISVMYANN